MIVIPGPASQELGEKIAKLLNVETAPVVFKKFPDGETYIRLEGDLKGEELVIVQTTSPPQETRLMQLFLMADTAEELGAKTLTAVVPYLAYARQDRRFLPGEAVSIRTVAKLLATSGVNRLLTVNVHKEKVLKKFGFPAKSLSAMTVLAEHFKDKGLAGAFAIAPDEGALGLAEEAGKVLGGGYGWLRKKRDRYTGGITTEKKQFDVEGKDVIIFDDIISSGKTTANAVKILTEQNARRVYAACVHPLLMGDAEKIIMRSGAEAVVGTDSVPSSVSVVSVAPLIARALTEKEAF
ncbi:MAG: ribose-phosphate diphosphokinase [Thermoproteota archaeon]|nr:ribose-phosphate diphosphokinase [Thermoproteota archaeon]